MAKTILIIEDEENIRGLLRKILEKEGYDVIEAPNGEVGTRLYRQHLPDLIITDLIMPEKEGIETIRELRLDYPDAKIIAMSGGGNLDPEQYLQIAEGLGVLKTFSKPFMREEIIEAVNELIV